MIDIGSNHARVIGTLNQMKCWGSGEDGKTGHENTASYGDDDKEMGQAPCSPTSEPADLHRRRGRPEAHLRPNQRRVREVLGKQPPTRVLLREDGSGARGDGHMEMGSAIPSIARFGPDNSANPGHLATSISVETTTRAPQPTTPRRTCSSAGERAVLANWVKATPIRSGIRTMVTVVLLPDRESDYRRSPRIGAHLPTMGRWRDGMLGLELPWPARNRQHRGYRRRREFQRQLRARRPALGTNRH